MKKLVIAIIIIIVIYGSYLSYNASLGIFCKGDNEAVTATNMITGTVKVFANRCLAPFWWSHD